MRDEDTRAESAGPVARDVLGASARGIWGAVPDAHWNGWRWRHRHRLRTVAEVERLVRLTPGERRAIAQTAGAFRMALTPYYAALMDPDDAACPVRRQAIPSEEELVRQPEDLDDPLGEE